MMNKPAWEEYADAEKYDSTFDKSFEIPYEITPTELKKRDKEIIEKVKTLLLEYTHYDSRDDITFMDNVNFEIISEELDDLLNK